MNKKDVLQKLQSGKPLFDDELPKFTPSDAHVMGIETELGVAEKNDEDASTILEDWKNRQEWQENGGRIYVDLGRLVETCTPECSNPLETALYQYSMWKLAEDGDYSPRLYANNRGKVPAKGYALEETFGFHENYSSTLSILERNSLIPFLVARILVTGSGFYNQRGEFEISQRAPYICKLLSEKTQEERGFLGSRAENIENSDIDSETSDMRRIHLITADTNICEVQTFLKIGMTSLAIQLIEAGTFPFLPYNEENIQDLHRLNLHCRDWITRKNVPGLNDSTLPKVSGSGPLSFLWRFYHASVALYSEKNKTDKITELFLLLFDDTLIKLSEDPLSLCGRLDWVTKLVIFRQAAKENNAKPDHAFNHYFDTGYHRLGSEGGHAALVEMNQMERLFSEELILRKMNVPPEDTRAYFRGRLIAFCRGKGLGKVEMEYSFWNSCKVKFKKAGIERHDCFDLPDAHHTYKEMLGPFIAQL